MSSRGTYRRHAPELKIQLCHDIRIGAIGRRDAAKKSTTCAAAGLRSVVLKLASASRPAPCDEPSFVGNARVEDALRQAGVAFAAVRPTMYLDNLLKPSARQEIVEDGVPAHRLDLGRRLRSRGHHAA